jgi:hypothetical protein
MGIPDGQTPIFVAASLTDFGQGVAVFVRKHPDAGKTGRNEFHQSGT